MTVALTGAGSWGVRLGHVFGRLADLGALRGGKAGPNYGTGGGFPTNFSTLNTDLANGTALPKTQAKDAPYTQLATFQNTFAGFYSWAAQLVQDVTGAMVNLDQAAPEDAAYNAVAAAKYIQGQMFGGSYSAPTATLQGSTVTIGVQTNVNTPAGNPVIVLSAKNVFGQNLQLPFPETLTFATARDSQNGGTAGSEQVSWAGEPGLQSVWAYNYPAGSGASGSLTLADGTKSNNGQNLLQNSDFATFTGAVPDNWLAAVGAAQISNGSAHAYTTGGGAVAFTGDSSTLTKITQSFKTTPVAGGGGGTSYQLLPDTQYAVNCWVEVPAGVPTAGVLRISLQDGAGNVLNDDTGTANSLSTNLHTFGGGVGNAWVNLNACFRTPANLTTQTGPFKLVVELTTALTTGFVLYVGRFGMQAMVPLYAGGPYAAGFSGSTLTIAGANPDSWTFAVTNNYSTTGSGLFHQYLDRVFGLRANGLQFPYAASTPTVADSLIA